MRRRPLLLISFSVLLGSLPSAAQESTALIEATSAAKQWSFNNGAEFPGATGSLSVDAGAVREGKPTLKLVGDFTGGGGYDQVGHNLDRVEIRELSMWIRSPDIEQFTLRLNDSSGQTHQLNLKTKPSTDWQRIDLPLERFFKRRGQTDAFTGVGKYEYWGGAKDGNWQGPATAIYLLLGNHGANKVRTLWINDARVTSPPIPVAGADIKTVVRLDELADWNFSDGQEFKGAKGSQET
ncbi:MAG: hypothetical protein ACI8XO_000706 [Verrucomicrobiales bacterium]|jgi:hypothetical protein